MIYSLLTRIHLPENKGKQTLGINHIYDGINLIYTSYVLELPWKNNQRNISCIPDGDYIVSKRKAKESPSRDYDHFIIEDVPNRSYILWHAGNYHWNIKGCQLHGQGFTDLNNDGLLDVTNTKFTISQLYKILPERFPYKIISINNE